MAKIKINLSGGELTIEFTNTKDLEDQLEKIDFLRIDSLLNTKNQKNAPVVENEKMVDKDVNAVKELGSINILKISERGQDAVKLAIFLATNGMNREEIKKITGITILSS
ncbi:MAG: hypothetical protein ACREBB_08445 [Nitrosotalea sp.]